MSQYGAEGMAREGYTYQDILNSMLDLGLDPTTTTKEQFIAALQSEADISLFFSTALPISTYF